MNLQQISRRTGKIIRISRMPMRTRLFFRPGETLLVCFLLSFCALPVGAKEVAGEDIFRDCVIPNIHLILSPATVASLTQNGNSRQYLQATVREGGKTYTNVAIRLKGGPGSRRPFQDKPAFTLNFEKFAPGQKFHGLKKIHLNNSVQDHTYLHEKLSRELFEAAGVPVPRAGNAWVNCNDRELGMYVLLEGVNKQFLKRYFSDVTGNIYDGHAGNDVTTPMRVNSGEEPKGTRLRDLADAVQEPDIDARWAAIQKTLDVDRFFSFIAVELMLGHWDGYTMNRNNWRIYHDKDSDRMVFIPHGLDQVLGRNYQMFPQNSQALVVRSVFEIPEARKRYRERYAQIATNVFNVEAMTNRIHYAGEKIVAVLTKHDEQAADNEDKVVSAICHRIASRSIALKNQINPQEPTRFDREGATILTQWTSKVDGGDAELNRDKDSNGNALLHIAAKTRCTASWRTTVEVPPGQYRLEAKIKTKGVVFKKDDPRDGAGLRVSRHRTGQKNDGDREWTPIHFDFQVQENQAEVELVCELRASQGEIWYDVASLKLMRK
jgi:spore coat protein H